MPANLPPDYYEVEKEFRAATSNPEKIALLEEMLSIIPKHKGTDHLRGDLRRKLAKLRERPQGGAGASKHETGFNVDREGAGQVAVIGPTNVGKSALVAALTAAQPEVAAYPFTTWVATPGMMAYEDIQIQLIDTPPLTQEHEEPMLYDLIRRADMALLLVDLTDFPIQQLEDTVALLVEHRIVPVELQEETEIQRRTKILPLLVVATKCDDDDAQGDFEVLVELLERKWRILPFSATTLRGADELKRQVFEMLEVMRIYCKPPGQDPDYGAPFTLGAGSSLEEFAGLVHKDFVEQLKSARVWGTGVFDGQQVGRDHILHDGDVVELRT